MNKISVKMRPLFVKKLEQSTERPPLLAISLATTSLDEDSLVRFRGQGHELRVYDGVIVTPTDLPTILFLAAFCHFSALFAIVNCQKFHFCKCWGLSQ